MPSQEAIPNQQSLRAAELSSIPTSICLSSSRYLAPLDYRIHQHNRRRSIAHYTPTPTATIMLAIRDLTPSFLQSKGAATRFRISVLHPCDLPILTCDVSVTPCAATPALPQSASLEVVVPEPLSSPARPPPIVATALSRDAGGPACSRCGASSQGCHLLLHTRCAARAYPAGPSVQDPDLAALRYRSHHPHRACRLALE